MKRFLEWGLILVVVGSVLAFGGVQPLAYSLMEVSVFLLIFVALIAQARQGKVNLPVPLAMLPFVFLVLLQVVPLPPQLVALCSPARLVLTPHVAQQPAGSEWITLTIYRHQTLEALCKLLAYCGAFVLATLVFDSQKRRSALVQALILLGCFEAAYGIIQYLTGFQKIFTYTKEFYTQQATGTYINRNHFAGFLELIIPFAVASIFYAFQVWSSRQRSGFGRAASVEVSSAGFQAVFYVFLLVILAVGVVFSQSRGGILASLLSIMLMALLAQLKTKRKIWMVGSALFLFCVIGYGIWIGLDPVLGRFEQIREPGYIQMEGRTSIWNDTLRLIRDYPLTGTGLGTFGVAYHRYQTTLLEYSVDHAHNAYMELAADTGLLGAALLFLPILYLFIKMIGSFLDDPRRYRRAVTLGCIGGTFALLIHSVTEFNLQIPANALVFAVVMGIGYKAACVERRDEKPNTASYVVRVAPVSRL